MASLEQIGNDISEIKKCLLGSDLTGEGLIEVVKKNKKRIYTHQKLHYMIIGGYLLLVFLLMFIDEIGDLIK